MNEQKQEKKSNKTILIIIITVIVIAAGVGIYFFTQNKNTNATTNTTTKTNTTTTNTSTDPYANLSQYDGKVITISSANGKVTGQAAIAFRMSEEMPIQVVYFLKVKDALPKKATSFSGASYDYIANHDKANELRVGQGTGVLSAAYCNTDQTPDILTMAKAGNLSVTTYSGCADEYAVNASTDTFYHIYVDYYNNYTFDYNEIVGKDTLAVFDTAPYYSEDPSIDGYSLNVEKAIQEGTIAAQYSLTYAD